MQCAPSLFGWHKKLMKTAFKTDVEHTYYRPGLQGQSPHIISFLFISPYLP